MLALGPLPSHPIARRHTNSDMTCQIADVAIYQSYSQYLHFTFFLIFFPKQLYMDENEIFSSLRQNFKLDTGIYWFSNKRLKCKGDDQSFGNRIL